MADNKPLLAVSISANVEFPTGKKSIRREGFGLSLLQGQLCIAAGTGDSAITHPLRHVVKCHTRVLSDGKVPPTCAATCVPSQRS